MYTCFTHELCEINWLPHGAIMQKVFKTKRHNFPMDTEYNMNEFAIASTYGLWFGKFNSKEGSRNKYNEVYCRKENIQDIEEYKKDWFIILSSICIKHSNFTNMRVLNRKTGCVTNVIRASDYDARKTILVKGIMGYALRVYGPDLKFVDAKTGVA